MGSTGNLYSCVVGTRVTCTCPDAVRSAGMCKHALLVKHRVLKIPLHSQLLCQSSYLAHELAYIYAHAPAAPGGSVVAAEGVRAAYARATGRDAGLSGDAPGSTASVAQPSASTIAAAAAALAARRRSVDECSDCAVCYEELGGSLPTLTWCVQCGNNLHAECMTMWAKSKRTGGQAVTCPLCRCDWAEPDSPAAAAFAAAAAPGAAASPDAARDSAGSPVATGAASTSAAAAASVAAHPAAPATADIAENRTWQRKWRRIGWRSERAGGRAGGARLPQLGCSGWPQRQAGHLHLHQKGAEDQGAAVGGGGRRMSMSRAAKVLPLAAAPALQRLHPRSARASALALPAAPLR
jgi:hypothetical protein